MSGSFTPTISDEYYVSITALPAAENEITFTVDNFYAYVLPPSPTDYVSLFQPDVLAYNDYYPFGSLVPNRHGSSSSYRYGFNGMEKDDEVKGEGNSLDFGARMYDPRIGRWFKTDKAELKYPSLSPFSFANNSPLIFKDIDGNDIFIVIVVNGKRQIVKYDREMSDKGVNKAAKETINALNLLYDKKALEIKYPDKDSEKTIDILGYFMKPENDVVIMPGDVENKSFPSKYQTQNFKKLNIDTSKYDMNSTGSTYELDTSKTGFIQWNPNSGIIFATDKTVVRQDIETFKKSVNTEGIKGFSYYSEKYKIGMHSPVLQLAHEFGHLISLFEDPINYEARGNNKGEAGVIRGRNFSEGVFNGRKAMSAEEIFVLDNIMTQINIVFGAPNPYDHAGGDVETKGSTTLEPAESPDVNKGG